MQDYEINHHIEAWRTREERRNRSIAVLKADLGNIIFAANGGKGNFKVEDFFGVAPQAKRQTAEQMRAMAILAFGPPPKKESN